ncbi:hypothetical protein [Candidatus Thiosymbion oneisti]|uniref:hypothetical protein n=1 Tax=Candidatus Thiosymbion oneisti TaxID=589554 RepID=UPI0013FD2FB6|nr:hypothetical protein [Candidatus Thiosymbion oneisti]
MSRRCFYPLPVLVAVVMFVSGCGTTKLPDLVDLRGNRPWVFLADAEVQQAKSLAMGSAVTKGWKIADASGDKLLVRRPLSTTTAMAIAGEPVSTAAVEVKTDFNQRRAGVDVVVAATMVADKITAKGQKSVLRIDVTDSYRNELDLSLNALRRSWEENRWRIAAAMRPLPTKDVVSKGEDTEDTFGAIAGRETDTAAASPPEKTAAAPIAASSTDDRAMTAAVPSTRGQAAPVEDRALSAPPPITSGTTDRAMTAAVPSSRGRVAPIEDQAPSAPPPITSGTTDRAMTAAVPSSRGRVAPIEDQAPSAPPPITSGTTDRAMTAAVPSTRGQAAPIEDQALSVPRPITPSATDRAMAAVAPSSRGGVAPVEDRALSTPRPITPSTTDRAMAAAVPSRSSRGGVAPIEDQALSAPRPITPGTTDRAMAAAVPSRSSRGGVAPIEDQALSAPRPITPGTTDRAMAAAVPSRSSRGGVAPVEDRALSMLYSITPSTTDSAMTTAIPSGVGGINDGAMTAVPPVGVSSRAAPIEDRALSTPRHITRSTPPSTLSAVGPTGISALDYARKAGAWAYYAEQYARTHGCEPLGGRTTLEYTHPKFELHRVRCENGGNLFLRCSAGTCIRVAEN